MAGKQTPLMQQYWGIKNQHLDKILLFRMGDFFEIFHEDAEVAAPILNIALTQRNKKSADNTKMCGVPYHSVGPPIGKLLSAGHKVAICDQVEDPKKAQGIVKREVTRILSPGMVYDPETLDQLQANYICSFDEQSVSFLEASTGEAFYYLEDLDGEDRGRPDFRQGSQNGVSKNSIWGIGAGRERGLRHRLLESLKPVELVLSAEMKAACFTEEMSRYHISSHEVSEPTPSEFKSLPLSAQRLISYVRYMKGESIYQNLCPFEKRQLHKVMSLKPTVMSHLEIFRTCRGEKNGSLFHAMNRTQTAMGARLLKNWLSFPLTDIREILRRQDRVQFWYERPVKLKELRGVFSGMGDVERRLNRVESPPHLLALCKSLRAGLAVSVFCEDVETSQVRAMETLVNDMEAMISEEAPVNFHKGGVIRRGVNSELDELIQFDEEGQRLLLDMEEKEKKATGIPSLKIRYNNVFGYYIEVTHIHREKVPDHYKRKQTLTQAERYVTEELQDLEDKILSARARRVEREQDLFRGLCKKISHWTPELLLLSRLWSQLDVLSSLAHLAQENNYCRPQFVEKQPLDPLDPLDVVAEEATAPSPHSAMKGSMMEGVEEDLPKAPYLELRACRHPVVEPALSTPFVPNDVVLKKGECLLLTGPNMAGKSTVMRQVAVISLMAQIGSFVPAHKAVLPVFHRLFTRVGANDFLTEGLSTFMVEMKEAAEILNEVDENSLVILDEVGRGTSTYDGMSLAQAILEFLVLEKRPLTLFATHYHELTLLSQIYPQIRNTHMSIREKRGEIHFLHLLVQGAANKSYGIQVAKLAGLPPEVTRRAAARLRQLELHSTLGTSPESEQLSLWPWVQGEGDERAGEVRGPENSQGGAVLEKSCENSSQPVNSLSQNRDVASTSKEKKEELLEDIRSLDLHSLTPIEALNQISLWQKECQLWAPNSQE